MKTSTTSSNLNLTLPAHNTAQLQAINSRSSDILSVATAGSGKTATLIARIMALIALGVPAREIVAITFTNAGADEIQSRIGDHHLGYAGTLHGYMLRLLQLFGATIGLAPNISVMDEEQSKAFRDDVLQSMNYKGTLEAFESALLEGPPPRGKTLKPIDICVGLYYQTMMKSGLLDFDAILFFGLRLLMEKHPNLRVQHLFWDEYQDSGPIDARIRRALRIPNKFTVGDPDQSIFGFRQASVKNILSLANAPTTELILMEINYRSDKLICNAAQRLIEHNPKRVAKRTIANSAQDGEIIVWKDLPTPGREAAEIAKDIAKNGNPDCAILVRSNDLVGFYTGLLRDHGVKLAERGHGTTSIPDWARCRLLLTLLANPENNFIAKLWVEREDGPKMALDVYLEAMAKKTTINAIFLKVERKNNLEEIVESAWRYNVSSVAIGKLVDAWNSLPPDSSVAELLCAVSRDIFTPATKTEGVVVSTIHGAKGREWDTVYLPAFEQQVIPSNRKKLDIEEERRIAFVAITRARHRLVISYALQRQTQWQRQPEPSFPSQFITEALGNY